MSSIYRLGSILAIAPILLLSAGAASAQLIPGVPVTIEVRPGVTLPTGGVTETGPGLGAEVGFGVGASTRVDLLAQLAVSAGYQYGTLGCGACGGVGLQEDLAEEGFEAGVRWTPTFFTLAGLEPWVGVDALIQRKLQVSGAPGDLVSDPAIGWSAGAGVLLPLTRSLALNPGIHVRGYSAEFTIPDLGFDLLGESDSFVREVDVLDLSMEVGLSYEF